MAGNNDFNLVISDEERSNLFTGRSVPNTLSQQGSPAAQFAGWNTGEFSVESVPHKSVVSPLPRDVLPTYDNEFGSHRSEGQAPFHHEEVTGFQANVEYYSSVQPPTNLGSNTKAQFIKKAKRQQNEINMFEEDIPKRGMYGGTFSAPNLQNEIDLQAYKITEEPYDQIPDRMAHTANEGFGEEYGNSRELFQDEEELRAQSLRDSQLSGPVRYSKMTEEEAARAFENRKKELFSTYLKKGPKKNPGQKGISPGKEGLKVNTRELPLQEEGKYVNGFVIYNNKNNETPNQPPSAKFKGQTDDNDRMKRRSSIEQKENTSNTMNYSKQRRESPNPKNIARQNAQRQSPKPKTQYVAPKANTNNKRGPKETQSNKMNVDLKRTSQNKAKNEYVKGHYSLNSDLENRATTETYQDKNRRSFPTQPTDEPENNNPYYKKIDKKNKEILNDIHNLDEEIYRLESETNRKLSRRENGSKNADSVASLAQRQTQTERDAFSKEESANRNRSRSLQRDNSFEKKEQDRGKKPSRDPSPNVGYGRDRTRKTNELYSEKDVRYTEMSQGSVKNQLHESYMVLNEKGFEQHSDYLYERAMIKKKRMDFLQEKNKEIKEKQELMQCTFSPQIKLKKHGTIEDIVTKTRNWQLQKEKQIQIYEKNKIEKELRECTFYPNGILDKDTKLEFNPNDFYKRNIEWAKRKEAESIKKQNEIYQSMMTAPEKSKSHASLSFSRMNDSAVLRGGEQSPAPGGNRGIGLRKSSSNKSLRSTTHQGERASSYKKRETSEKKISSSTKTLNRSVTRFEDHTSNRPEKPLETQENADNNKDANNLNMQSQILESYAILDGLRNMLHTKEKEKQEKLVKERQGVASKLKTVNLQPKSATTRPESKPQQQTSKKRGFSPNHSQSHLSGKIPATSIEFETKPLEENVISITVKNNRYYMEEKPYEKAILRVSRERSNSKESKIRPSTPTRDYGSAQFNREGSYAAAVQAKKRGESPYKSKQINKINESSISKSSYSELMASPLHSIIASPQPYGLFATVKESPRNELNYVTKGITSPSTQALEKKYLTLLSQVSRVTKQLDNISGENNTLQQDINSLQRRQMTKSLLYS